MAEQDIVSIGYDPAFAAQNKEVYEQVLSTYNLLKQMDGLKVSGAGYSDLKVQAAALQRQIQELTAANLKLTQSIAEGNTVQKQASQTTRQIEAEKRRDAKITSDLSNEYKQFSLAARDAKERALSYQLTLGKSHPVAIAATKDALDMNTRLKELDASVGVYNRNVGNYSSAFTNFANTLRGVRGPTKLLGEALGVGAQEADQFRIVIEHAAQGIAAFFKAKEQKAAAEAADTAATEVNTAAQQAQETTVAGATGTTNTFSIATEGAAVAETELAVATTATSTAMRVLKVALLSLGIIAVVAGIAILAYQLYQVATAVSEAEKNQKLYNDAIKEAAKGAASEVAHLVAIKEKLLDIKTPQADRIKYVNDYNKVADEGNKIDATQIDNLDLINKKINEQIGLIEKRALAKAAENELSKQAEKVISAQLEVDRYQEYADGAKLQELRNKNAANEQENAKVNNKSNSDNLAQRNNYMKAYTSQNADILSGQKKYIDAKKILNKEQAALDRLAGVLSPLFVPGEGEGSNKNAASKAKDLTDKTAEEILKINFEMGKRHLQIQIDSNKEIYENEKGAYDERLNALSKYNDARIAMLELERQFEIDSENAKYNEIKKGISSQDPATVKGGQAAIDAQLQKEKEVHLLRLINLESKYYDELRRQGQSYLKDIKKLEQEQLDIKKAFLDQELDYEEWTRKQILKAREAQSKGMAAYDKSDEDRAKEKNKILIDGAEQFAGKAIELTQTLVDAGYTRQQNAIQDLINANNEYASAETQRISTSTLNEQEKAAKIIVLNESVAAKNKQLAQQQKELDIKKAQFDKEAGIAKIILNTAIGATNALTTGDPYTAGLRAGIVIALGAAELAIAIATPIPTYAEGGIHPGGYAIWAEAGVPEHVKPPGQPGYISYEPTMGILPAGTVLTPLSNGVINDSMIASQHDRAELINAIENRKTQTDWEIARYLASELKQQPQRRQPIQVNNKIDLAHASWVNQQIFGRK